MTKKNSQPIESLASGLLEQYREIESLVKLIEQSVNNVDRVKLFDNLNILLLDAKRIEGELAPLRTEFADHGVAIPTATRQQVNQTVAIVTRLIPRLGTLEERARKERLKLAPQIHDGVRALQMQSAYSQNR